MSLLGDLFGTSGAEHGLNEQAALYGGLAKSNLPRGLALLWNIIGGQVLTPGARAQQSIYDSDLLAGYQRALGDTLRENQARGLSNSLLDMNTRTALARGYAGDRARNAAGLMGQSEAEKRQMLQLLLQLASGFGSQAMQGYGSAANVAQGNWQTLGNLLTTGKQVFFPAKR